VIVTGSLDDMVTFLDQDYPTAELLPALTAALGEEYQVLVDPSTTRAYIGGPAWWESAVQPGEGECDTWTVEEMTIAELLDTEQIAAAIGEAESRRHDPRDLELLEEAARVRALPAHGPSRP
jgi:hypothetical protein